MRLHTFSCGMIVLEDQYKKPAISHNTARVRRWKQVYPTPSPGSLGPAWELTLVSRAKHFSPEGSVFANGVHIIPRRLSTGWWLNQSF